MNLIENGAKVHIANNEIVGTVISVSIDGIKPNTTIMYKVTWWCSGTRHTDWLYSFELEPYVEVKKKAGLVNYETSLEVISE